MSKLSMDITIKRMHCNILGIQKINHRLFSMKKQIYNVVLHIFFIASYNKKTYNFIKFYSNLKNIKIHT